MVQIGSFNIGGMCFSVFAASVVVGYRRYAAVGNNSCVFRWVMDVE